MTPNRCRGPINRRSFLEAGSLAAGGLALSDLLRSRALASRRERPSKDTAVILIWLQGGPSHMETYDLKPEAPAEYRGECRPIKTAASGLEVCEHLPLHAKVADRFTLIRSISHGFANHAVALDDFCLGTTHSNRLIHWLSFPALGRSFPRCWMAAAIPHPSLCG